MVAKVQGLVREKRTDCTKEHEKKFQGDGNVLYHDCCHMTIHFFKINQAVHLKLLGFIEVYVNKVDKEH